MSAKEWLKHAFAVETPPAAWTADETAALEALAQQVVRRRLTGPALVWLEMSRPLNYLGAQALHFFAPMISAITDSQLHRHFAAILERREAVDRLIGRIEALQAGAEQDQNGTNSAASSE